MVMRREVSGEGRAETLSTRTHLRAYGHFAALPQERGATYKDALVSHAIEHWTTLHNLQSELIYRIGGKFRLHLHLRAMQFSATCTLHRTQMQCTR